jgi:hypothetical protein
MFKYRLLLCHVGSTAGQRLELGVTTAGPVQIELPPAASLADWRLLVKPEDASAAANITITQNATETLERDGGLCKWVLAPDGKRASFTTLRKYIIRGVGEIINVELAWHTTRTGLAQWRGKLIFVDGAVETVRRVESHCVELHRKGWTVGLLLEPRSLSGSPTDA